MNFSRISLILLTSIFSFSAEAQQNSQRYTISGYIQDLASGERLPGATLIIRDTKLGTVSNKYGFFSITLPPQHLNLMVSYLGYATQSIPIELTKDTHLIIKLKENITTSTDVEINATPNILETTQMGVLDLSIEQIKKIPLLLGETDVLKAIQTLPGVKAGNEGTAGFYVRGGGADQNLILLDDATVYNAAHLFGFVSVFNADAIQNISLIKGGFPARYGERLSSVLDITMKEGDMHKTKLTGSIGLVASRATLEGPILKEKSSYILSFRRTYIDAFLTPIYKLQESSSGNKIIPSYYFGDLNAKINYKPNYRHHLFASVYWGKDKLNIQNSKKDLFIDKQENAGLEWKNLTSTLRWNYIISPKLFLNTILNYSQYNLLNQSDFSEYSSNITQHSNSFYASSVRDIGYKTDLQYIPNPNHNIRFGFRFINHLFHPGIYTYNNTYSDDATSAVSFQKKQANISSRTTVEYIENDFRATTNLKMNLGVHWVQYKVEDTVFSSFQPRFSGRYKLGQWALKGSFATMEQHIHLLTNNGIGLPTDLWLPATKNVKPQSSWQAALGVSHLKDEYEFSMETYYKKLYNTTEYKEGASFMTNYDRDWQDNVTQGTGEGYGIEFFLQKKEGKTTGWFGYTLSWSNRQFTAINQGQKFPFTYDRRHDLSLVLNHTLKKGLDISLNWVFNTGNAATFPESIFTPAFLRDFLEHGLSPRYFSYPSRNGIRMPNYHRMDLGLNWTKSKKWGEQVISIGLYNVYNKKNPFFIFLQPIGNGAQVYKKISLFPVLPFVSYNFKL
ncbi:MAG: TonB-dependent receptor [Rhodothermia bacterium]|nr:TonB-dependent receptor [Rhodothermia bacterium]